MKSDMKRRNFLRWGAAGVGAAVLSWKASALETCVGTAAQTAGPFYPGESQFTPNNDLTHLPGASRSATGQVIHIQGVIRDQMCRPISGAQVEIWQACASGRYNNDNDPNPAPIDPAFKYWGEDVSNANGEYSFKTIIPGAYPADTDWDRPPHIHFRLSKLGYHELITQMYFKGHPLNNADKILLNVPAHLRADVIVDFQANPSDPTSQIGVFNITLLKV